jgi:hypothetical protein
MRFSLRTHIVDVRYCAGRMACHDTADVQSVCDRETLFSPTVPELMFSLL